MKKGLIGIGLVALALAAILYFRYVQGEPVMESVKSGVTKEAPAQQSSPADMYKDLKTQ